MDIGDNINLSFVMGQIISKRLSNMDMAINSEIDLQFVDFVIKKLFKRGIISDGGKWNLVTRDGFFSFVPRFPSPVLTSIVGNDDNAVLNFDSVGFTHVQYALAFRSGINYPLILISTDSPDYELTIIKSKIEQIHNSLEKEFSSVDYKLLGEEADRDLSIPKIEEIERKIELEDRMKELGLKLIDGGQK